MRTILVSDIRETERVGRAKYVVSYHVLGKVHPDGSDFYDIRIFASRRLKDAFVSTLRIAE